MHKVPRILNIFFFSFSFGIQYSFAKNVIDVDDAGYCSALSQSFPGLSNLCSFQKQNQSSFVFIRSVHYCSSGKKCCLFTNICLALKFPGKSIMIQIIRGNVQDYFLSIL